MKKNENELISLKIIKQNNIPNISIYYLLLLQDGRIAVGYDDGIIGIFSLKNDIKLEIELIGHTESVLYFFQSESGKLISCSYDRSIKIWNIEETSYNCEYTIKDAHDESICQIISLHNNKMASSSNDNKIKIWKKSKPYCLIQIIERNIKNEGHIYIYSPRNSEVLFAMYDNDLCIWNLLTYQCETIINKIYNYYSGSFLEIPGNKIIFGGYNLIQVIDIISFKSINIIKDNQLGGVYSMIYLNNGVVLCGVTNGYLFAYEIKSNKIQKIKNIKETDDITSLISYEDNFIITASFSSYIKLMKY